MYIMSYLETSYVHSSLSDLFFYVFFLKKRSIVILLSGKENLVDLMINGSITKQHVNIYRPSGSKYMYIIWSSDIVA